MARWLPNAIVTTPNADRTFEARDDASAGELAALGVSRQLRVAVGPPDASLSVWIVEPSAGAPHATVLVCHGLHDQKRSLLPVAKHLAADGYRAVLVDLRGHGRSSGRWLTYGFVEAADLSQVLDALERENLLTGPVGVYGTSYGAACALMVAGRDPRVRAVVSVAPFTTMQDEVPYFIRHSSKVPRWFITDETIARAINDAGKLAGFDPKQASPLTAIQNTQAHVLLIHGEPDEKVSTEYSRQLHAATPRLSQLMLIPSAGGHDLLFRDRGGAIARATQAWFKEWL
ncbi:MAG TPA: alpha/beta fold hydrolase [Verrucomicrobiae bacterium]|nr:alpha/beta fold hydrolase [Verrucomicrobiae bacterium]